MIIVSEPNFIRLSRKKKAKCSLELNIRGRNFNDSCSINHFAACHWSKSFVYNFSFKKN